MTEKWTWLPGLFAFGMAREGAWVDTKSFLEHCRDQRRLFFISAGLWFWEV